ncbi:flagellar filament capping protein FliD [candidate division KSB1 bacterium]
MATISSISSGLSSVEQLVQQFMEKEKQPVYDLQSSRSALSSRLNIYTDVKSTLTKLRDLSKNFTRVGTLNSLIKRTATSSNENFLKVTAAGNASIGTHALRINRLASADTGISKQLTNDGLDLAGKTEGLQEFTIAVGSGDAVTISVTVDAADTNETVMQKVRDAINEADVDVNASIVHDTANTSRLIIKSSETGSDKGITLVETGGAEILQELNYIDKHGARILSSGTDGGFVVDNIADLDAEIEFDGITIYKSQNEITDILEGVTFNLVRAQEPDDIDLSFTINKDTSNAKTEIEAFIEQYNSVIKYLNEKTRVDPVNKFRGDLAGDVVFGGLKYSIRSIMSTGVTGIPDTDLQFLYQIGISIARDGTLSIKDSDKFDEKLDADFEGVTGLFSSENGYGAALTELLDNFVNSGGAVDRSKKSINNRISSIDLRIKNYEARLLIKAESLRRKFTDLQRTLSLLNSQQTTVQNYLSGGFGASGAYSY